MTGPTAVCPLCHKVKVIRIDGTYPKHRDRYGRKFCPASFWLVEPEELAS